MCSETSSSLFYLKAWYLSGIEPFMSASAWSMVYIENIVRSVSVFCCISGHVNSASQWEEALQFIVLSHYLRLSLISCEMVERKWVLVINSLSPAKCEKNVLTHCGPDSSYGDIDLVNIVSGNGLVSSGNNQECPDPMWKNLLTYCGPVTPYGDTDMVNIGSVNGLLPDGTKPLPEPMLTSQ